MTYYSTTTLTPTRPPNAVEHDGRFWDTRPDAPDRDAHLAAVGIVLLGDTARPADTDTTIHDRTVALINGAPTVVWTAREWTADEVQARTAEVNGTTIRGAAANALAVNRDFLALDTPTSAQVVAQVRALTRQCQALIRLQLGALDDTD